MFYAKSTGGFYDVAIHGDAIPADAVEITVDEHAALINGQATGKVITADADGKPVLSDPPAPTAEQVAAKAKADALAYLASTDWYYARKLETGKDVPEDVVAKREAARAALQ